MIRIFSFPAPVIAALLSLLFLATTAHSVESKKAGAAEELRSLLQQAEALQGNFEQRLYDRDGHQLQRTEGSFVVQRPGNFYWETLPPYEQVVVGNGRNLWVYDPDLEQVTVHRQDQNQQATPAQLLSGELADLEEHYQVSLERDGDVKRFTLNSTGGEGLFTRLQLDYRGTTLALLRFEDNMGQVTELVFSDLKLNPSVDPALFEFDIPEGVDVIVDD